MEDAEKLGYPGDMLDTICESYRNVSCLFKAAEEVVREEVGYYLDELRDGGTPPYNEYGIDINAPYKGLFIKEGKKFIFTLNHTKKCGYSLDITKIIYQDGSICEYIDPLPILLGYGNRMNPGPWLGDVIGVDDELPAGYSLLSEIHLDW